jgi:MFS family permease
VIGAGVYMLAVFNRSTLGVAGPAALTRFGISAGQLGVFVMLQLAVYAGMQIPAGLLVDRFGPRRMLLGATLVMAAGQLGFALLPSYPLALLARGVLGCGDAMTYISVLRLIAAWFPGPRYALITSFSGFFGVVGNVIATVPLAALLPIWGWVPTFTLAGGLCLVYALILARPGTVAAPYRTPAEPSANPFGGRQIVGKVQESIHEPGGRLGFWVHFTTMSGSAVFTVLWGFPYMTEALGYSRGLASSLLLLLVVAQLVLSVTVGMLLGRRPGIRVPLAFAVSILNLIVWGVLIGWPGGHPPLGVIIVIMVILAIGGPSSMVGFMLARDYNPHHRMSTATGLVNAGGWIASLVGVLLVGQILDIVEPGVKTATGYRWAFVSILVITAFGLSRLIVWWLRVRAQLLKLQAEGGQGPITVRRRRFDASPRESDGGPAAGQSGGPAGESP